MRGQTWGAAFGGEVPCSGVGRLGFSDARFACAGMHGDRLGMEVSIFDIDEMAVIQALTGF